MIALLWHVISKTNIPYLSSGFAYSTLSDTWTAKALGEQIMGEFVQRSQNANGAHSVPKTLSMIDTRQTTDDNSNPVFPAFLSALDNYLATLTTLLDARNDAHFFASLHRARAEAVSYQKDLVVDLGEFVEDLVRICDPVPGSDLQVASRRVWQTYQQIFVDEKYGPGTEKGSGMIVDLPLIPLYQQAPHLWDGVRNENKASVPSFEVFFEAYVNAKPDTLNRGPAEESVCRNRGKLEGHLDIPAEMTGAALGFVKDTRGSEGGPGIDNTTTLQDSLFIDPKITTITEDSLVVETGVAVEGHSVETHYGINVTSLLNRALNSEDANSGQESTRLRRNLQTALIPDDGVGNDFLILYGGSLPGTFLSEDSDGAYKAKWDRQFAVLTQPGPGNTTEFHNIFVETPLDNEVVQSIPVVFFERFNKMIEQKGAVDIGMTVQAAELVAGAPGFLLFHDNAATGDDTFTLYARKCKMQLGLTGFASECSDQEITEEGFFAPIIPVRGIVNGNEVQELVGGYTGRVLNWTSAVPLKVETLSDKKHLEATQADKVVVEMVAKSFDDEIQEVHTFDIHPSNAKRVNPQGISLVQEDAQLVNDIVVPDGSDVAKCKPTIQSTTANGNVPMHALSGDLTTMSETECERSPFWMVDLLSNRVVHAVKIMNRQDCCMENLDGLVVELLDSEDDTIAFVQHIPDNEGHFGEYWIAEFDNVEAQKVRVSIQRPSGDCEILALASVQVYSMQSTDQDSCTIAAGDLGCDYGNVALCKPAIQSSTFELDDTGAGNAVRHSTFLAHTECEVMPWWEVDLNSERIVTQIVIKNREDCCFERLNGLKLELFGSSNELTAYFHRKYSLCILYDRFCSSGL